MKVIAELCDLPVVGGYIALFVALFPFVAICFFVGALDITVISHTQIFSLGGVLVLIWNYFVVRYQGLNIVLPLIPIPFWIIGIVWVFLGTWMAYDAMHISYHSSDRSFTIESVEKHGVGDNRFIKITGGTWGTQYVYDYDEKTKQVDSIVFPLVSQATLNMISDKEPITMSVLVRKDADTTVEEIDKWVNENGSIEESIDIEGIVSNGFDTIDSEKKILIESAKFKLHNNFILIEEGTKPSPIIISVLLFIVSIGGVILSLFVIKMRFSETSAEETTSNAETLEEGVAHYESGNHEIALKIFTSLAEQGDADAQYNLADMYAKTDVVENYKEAVKWFLEAAQQGHASAQFSLGLLYNHGLVGVVQNYNEAIQWYLKAAEQGNISAQYNLGFMYYKGFGVVQSYQEAFKWFLITARQGHHYAQYYLGIMYERGEGVVQNLKEAYVWSNLAASYGSARAAVLRDEVLNKMSQQQIAEAQQLAPQRQKDIDSKN